MASLSPARMRRSWSRLGRFSDFMYAKEDQERTNNRYFSSSKARPLLTPARRKRESTHEILQFIQDYFTAQADVPLKLPRPSFYFRSPPRFPLSPTHQCTPGVGTYHPNFDYTHPRPRVPTLSPARGGGTTPKAVKSLNPSFSLPPHRPRAAKLTLHREESP